MWRTLAFLAILSGPAAAGWRVETATDRFTDKPFTYATVQASDGPAYLRVQCVNGRLAARIVFPAPVAAWGEQIPAVFRLDNGPSVLRDAWLNRNLNELQPWGDGAETERLARHKRARVQISGVGLVDFDLTGFPQIRC
jgi:hypothetical protein